ncbi:hypothetical protein [Hugenholtzia roseola]|uniref:hypothetical protein n=1 Tax=Hugenholtzia roseola TaxID=1002 RepID=UPI0004091CCA|nr:hypothetical protein [Hugenholtzia roseola]
MEGIKLYDFAKAGLQGRLWQSFELGTKRHKEQVLLIFSYGGSYEDASCVCA